MKDGVVDDSDLQLADQALMPEDDAAEVLQVVEQRVRRIVDALPIFGQRKAAPAALA